VTDPARHPAPSAAPGPSKATVRTIQAGLVLVALLIVGVLFVTRSGEDEPATSSSPTGSASADGSAASPTGKAQWPTSVGGRPPALGVRDQPATEVQVAEGTPEGVYLWSDFDGWHLWVVGGSLPSISGSLTSNDPVSKAELAIPDAGAVEVLDTTVNFLLPGDRPLSGFDFNPGFFADQLVLTFEGPEGTAPPAVVWLGSKAAPASAPVVLAKEPR
jgi:hypothetical protein